MVRRRIPTATLLLWSKSTMVSFGQSLSYFLTRYNLASSFDEHSQNLKWLLPEKGFAIAIYYACRVELTRTEIDLEGSEPDTTCAMILNWHLEL